MKNTFILFLTSLSFSCLSQINTFYVEPSATDGNYAAAQDSHLVVRNTVTHLNKLFLFIGGTGSTTQNYQTISNFAGNLGYDVINLSYSNDVAAASLGGSSDTLIFDTYRQEVCYGTPASANVDVDTLNSIYTRTVKLLTFLNTTYPSENWDQYLVNPTTLDWSKIAVGGHSQGGGHAAYFAKHESAERVLMFSSPNDYSNFYSHSANWLRTPGVTPANKHFAYLSLLDEVVAFNKQLVNISGLELYPLYDTTHVDNLTSPFGNSHCLYTTQAPGLSILYHNSTMRFSAINNEVWEYMLMSTSSAGIAEVENDTEILVYPNPTTSEITIEFAKNRMNETYAVLSLSGQLIEKGSVTASKELKLNLSHLDKGIYFVKVGDEVVKLVKE